MAFSIISEACSIALRKVFVARLELQRFGGPRSDSHSRLEGDHEAGSPLDDRSDCCEREDTPFPCSQLAEHMFLGDALGELDPLVLQIRFRGL